MGRRPGSRDLLLNFGTPSISKERLKIQTSNLVCRLKTRGAIQKFAKLGQMGRGQRVTWPTFKFWDPLYIWGTTEVTNFKFCVSIDDKRYYPKNCKTRSKGRWPGSRNLLLSFGTPSISKERLKIQTSNLVCRVMRSGTLRKFAKLGQMGRRPVSRDLLLNFGTLSISKERLKIETSSLACRLTTSGSIQTFEKLGQMGRRPGSRDLLLNFGTPYIYRTAEDRNFKFGA